MMRSNWDQRRKQEVSNLVDLTASVNDKYGYPQSFLLKLRIQEGDPQVIKYKNPVSSKWRDPSFGALISDDRSKKVELIREIPNVHGAYISPRQQVNPSQLNLAEGTRNNLAAKNLDLSHVSKTESKHHESDHSNPYIQKRVYSAKSLATSNLTKEERIRLSQGATNLFRGEYNLE